jgi:hypothetical protein
MKCGKKTAGVKAGLGSLCHTGTNSAADSEYNNNNISFPEKYVVYHPQPEYLSINN